MRHVSDGDLHAWLDGALEHHAPSRAGEIRAHVESCPDCRSRLEEERAVRERADAVLAQADPGPVEAPPFEELRRRSEGRAVVPVRSGPGRMGILRMAATAVVALGVGWMAGRVSPPAPSFEGPAVPSTDAAPAPSPGTAVDPGSGATADAGSVEGDATSDATVEPPGGRSGRSEPGAVPSEEVEAAPVAPAAPAAADAGTASAKAPAPPVADANDRSESVAEMPPAPLEELARPPERDRGLAAAADARAALRSAEPRALGPVASSPVALAFVPSGAVASRPLVIPGLEVLSVEAVDLGPDGSVTSVRQRTADGDTLVLHLGGSGPADDPPASVLTASPPAGVRELVVRSERGWLVVRGRLTESRLRELVAPLLAVR